MDPDSQPGSYMVRQCQLRKGDSVRVEWIPARFAKVGRYVKLKLESGWDDGWKVEKAWGRLPIEYLTVLAREYRYHRQRTDI